MVIMQMMTTGVSVAHGSRSVDVLSPLPHPSPTVQPAVRGRESSSVVALFSLTTSTHTYIVVTTRVTCNSSIRTVFEFRTAFGAHDVRFLVWYSMMGAAARFRGTSPDEG